MSAWAGIQKNSTSYGFSRRWERAGKYVIVNSYKYTIMGTFD